MVPCKVVISAVQDAIRAYARAEIAGRTILALINTTATLVNYITGPLASASPASNFPSLARSFMPVRARPVMLQVRPRQVHGPRPTGWIVHGAVVSRGGRKGGQQRHQHLDPMQDTPRNTFRFLGTQVLFSARKQTTRRRLAEAGDASASGESRQRVGVWRTPRRLTDWLTDYVASRLGMYASLTAGDARHLGQQPLVPRV